MCINPPRSNGGTRGRPSLFCSRECYIEWKREYYAKRAWEDRHPTNRDCLMKTCWKPTLPNDALCAEHRAWAGSVWAVSGYDYEKTVFENKEEECYGFDNCRGDTEVGSEVA